MASAPEAVVTGDAVVLDVQIAQLPVRALGALIDMVIVAVGYLIAIVLWPATLPSYDDALTAAILITFTVGVLVGYPVVMETATRGRSVGKMVMGLGGLRRRRPGAVPAGPLSRSGGFRRIWMLAGGPAVIASLLSAKGKRIGDMFAGTVVLSERGPRSAAPPVMPPSLAWWSASLELSGLGPEQAEMARQFLARAAELNPPFEPRWPTASPPMGLPHLPASPPGTPRPSCLPPCSPNGTAANWPGFARHRPPDCVSPTAAPPRRGNPGRRPRHPVTAAAWSAGLTAITGRNAGARRAPPGPDCPGPALRPDRVQELCLFPMHLCGQIDEPAESDRVAVYLHAARVAGAISEAIPTGLSARSRSGSGIRRSRAIWSQPRRYPVRVVRSVARRR